MAKSPDPPDLPLPPGNPNWKVDRNWSAAEALDKWSQLTPRSRKGYEDSFRQLWNRFELHERIKGDSRQSYQAIPMGSGDPADYARWLAGSCIDQGWNLATWRAYRASARYGLARHWPAADAERAVEILNQTDGYDLREKRKKAGSSLKKAKSSRQIPYDIYRLIVDGLERDVSKALPVPVKDPKKFKNGSLILKHWIVAGVHTGLRPVEWINTVFNKKTRILTVQNAKSTHGGRNRETFGNRFLDLSRFPDDILASVQWMVRYAKSVEVQAKKDMDKAIEEGTSREDTETPEDRWIDVEKKARDNLSYRIRHTLKLPEQWFNVSLYSCRHQFAANMKSALSSRAEISSLLGHAVTKTATNHYGQKRGSWAPEEFPVPIPDPEEVSKILARESGPENPDDLDSLPDPQE